MRLGPLGLPELLLILMVLLLIFGARRLPEMSSYLGLSIRTFKRAVTGDDEREQGDSRSVNTITSDDRL